MLSEAELCIYGENWLEISSGIRDRANPNCPRMAESPSRNIDKEA